MRGRKPNTMSFDPRVNTIIHNKAWENTEKLLRRGRGIMLPDEALSVHPDSLLLSDIEGIYLLQLTALHYRKTGHRQIKPVVCRMTNHAPTNSYFWMKYLLVPDYLRRKVSGYNIQPADSRIKQPSFEGRLYAQLVAHYGQAKTDKVISSLSIGHPPRDNLFIEHDYAVKSMQGYPVFRLLKSEINRLGFTLESRILNTLERHFIGEEVLLEKLASALYFILLMPTLSVNFDMFFHALHFNNESPFEDAVRKFTETLCRRYTLTLPHLNANDFNKKQLAATIQTNL